MKFTFLQRRKALSSIVIRLGIISFFADVSSEMLYPITPIFLTSVLGASMLSVGIIEGVAEALSSLLKTYSGAWSDRIKLRQPFIVVGYTLAALAKPLIGSAHSWLTVLVARALDRSGKGIRTAPRDALLSDSVDAKYQGEAFGWHRLMDTFGAAVGPLVAVLFLKLNPNEMRPLYFWAVVPGLIAVIITFSIRDSIAPPVLSNQNSHTKLSWRDTSPSFKTYMLSWGLFSVGNSSDAFLILKAKQEGNSLITTILMYCFYNLTYATLSPYLGRLSDRFARRSLLAFGLFIFALVYLGFSAATLSWQFWALFGTYGVYMAATDGVGKALTVDLVPKEFKATGLGMLGTVTGIATIIASIMAGLLWDNYGSAVTFYYGSVAAITAAIFLMCHVPGT